jgi:hypothetical protein
MSQQQMSIGRLSLEKHPFLRIFEEMTALQTIEQIGNQAVKKLRLKKLRSGTPFMINAKELPSDQCYLELPGGSIQLVQLLNDAREFTVIRRLSTVEEVALRRKYGFKPL